jgi:hypothetical protein
MISKRSTRAGQLLRMGSKTWNRVQLRRSAFLALRNICQWLGRVAPPDARRQQISLAEAIQLVRSFPDSISPLFEIALRYDDSDAQIAGSANSDASQ